MRLCYETIRHLCKILEKKKPQWVFNQTAGALGQLQILLCAPREFLIFFGSFVGTEAHSGRYEMDVWDAMIQGLMWTALQGELQKTVHKEGDQG